MKMKVLILQLILKIYKFKIYFIFIYLFICLFITIYSLFIYSFFIHSFIFFIIRMRGYRAINSFNGHQGACPIIHWGLIQYKDVIFPL